MQSTNLSFHVEGKARGARAARFDGQDGKICRTGLASAPLCYTKFTHPDGMQHMKESLKRKVTEMYDLLG